MNAESPQYRDTSHVTAEIAAMMNDNINPDLISSRRGNGSEWLSYLKGDIIANELNNVFGPLGWSLETHMVDTATWEEEQEKTRNNIPTKIQMNVVQVSARAVLTIKAIGEHGTPTIFSQHGVGYGEAEMGKNRKQAYGMALKGAETDAFKRCASMLGRRFGLMLTASGKQDDVEYAHASNASRLKEIQGKRTTSKNNNARDRDERPTPRHDRNESLSHTQTVERPAMQAEANEQSSQLVKAGHSEAITTTPHHDRNDDRPVENKPKEASQEVAAEIDKSVDTTKKVRGPDKNANLSHLPMNKDQMIDFGATLIERVREMRQPDDREKLVRQHINTVQNLDGVVRRRTIERLKELNVDVNAIRT